MKLDPRRPRIIRVEEWFAVEETIRRRATLDDQMLAYGGGTQTREVQCSSTRIRRFAGKRAGARTVRGMCGAIAARQRQMLDVPRHRAPTQPSSRPRMPVEVLGQGFGRDQVAGHQLRLAGLELDSARVHRPR